MRKLRVALIILALLMLFAPGRALSMPFQFGSMGGFPNETSISQPITMANMFSQPSTVPGEYVEYAYPPSTVSSLKSGESRAFINNAIAGNHKEISDNQLVGMIPSTGINGLQLQPSLTLIPSNSITGSKLPINQFSRPFYISNKGPFGS